METEESCLSAVKCARAREVIKSSAEDGWIGLCNAEYFVVVIGTVVLSSIGCLSWVLFGKER